MSDLIEQLLKYPALTAKAAADRIKDLEEQCRDTENDYHDVVKRCRAIEAATIERCKRAIVNARFGPPSGWGGDRPSGWHLDRPCTPKEASHHDNGCNDAFMAVSALKPAAPDAKE